MDFYFLYEYNDGFQIHFVVEKASSEEEGFSNQMVDITNNQNPQGDSYLLISKLKSFPENWGDFKKIDEFDEFIDFDWFFQNYGKTYINDSSATVDELGGFNFVKISETYAIGVCFEDQLILARMPKDDQRWKTQPAIPLYGYAARYALLNKKVRNAKNFLKKRKKELEPFVCVYCGGSFQNCPDCGGSGYY